MATRATAERARSVCGQRDISELEGELRGLLAMIEATVGDHNAADVCLDRAQRLAEQTSLAISEALVANACGYRDRAGSSPTSSCRGAGPRSPVPGGPKHDRCTALRLSATGRKTRANGRLSVSGGS
jgi:hypothetical protein